MEDLIGGRFIGQIVPSSNLTVERTTERLLASYPGLSACYSRISYPSAAPPAAGYDHADFAETARRLGDAEVGALCWNGTRGALEGFDVDRDLVARMAEATGRPCQTVSLDVLMILERLGAKRIGLISQGSTERTWAIGKQFDRQGFATKAVRGFGVLTNLEGALIPTADIGQAVRGCVADAALDAVLIWGTNIPGLPVVAPLEAELGIPVVDSCSIGVWGCLAALGLSGAPLASQGRMFSLL